MEEKQLPPRLNPVAKWLFFRGSFAEYGLRLNYKREPEIPRRDAKHIYLQSR